MIDDDVNETQPHANADKRRGWPWLIVAALALFIGGMIGSPWFERNIRMHLPASLQSPDVGAVSARLEMQSGALAALGARVDALEARPMPLAPAPLSPSEGEQPALNDPAAIAAVTGGGADVERVARIEARVDTLDRIQTQIGQRVDNMSAEIAGMNVKVDTLGNSTSASIEAAELSASEARGVLLVAMTQRSIEQGKPLAALEPALRKQFGASNADAVDRLMSISGDVPTLDQLRRSFAAIRPALADGKQDDAPQGWWERFKSGLSDIVEVRRTGEPDARDANQRRIDAISQRLQRGEVARALAVLSRMPPGSQQIAREWRLQADTYVQAHRALGQLEGAIFGIAQPKSAAPPEAL